VVYELGRMMLRQSRDDLATTTNFVGFAAGLLVMYVTGLFVAG
jgi:hypothetical protein